MDNYFPSTALLEKLREEGIGVFIHVFLFLSNMVSFFSFFLLLSLYICSQTGYKFLLFYTFIIIPFVFIWFL